MVKQISFPMWNTVSAKSSLIGQDERKMNANLSMMTMKWWLKAMTIARVVAAITAFSPRLDQSSTLLFPLVECEYGVETDRVPDWSALIIMHSGSQSRRKRVEPGVMDGNARPFVN